MRAVFLQHDPGSRPGLIGDALADHGFAIDLIGMSDTIDDGTWHGTFPDLDGVDLLVPLGAIWSLYDAAQVGSWIDRELALLRAADARGIPVLGICFGGQALAAAHGGRVAASPRSEIGWVAIDSDDPELVPPGPWMQWHTDGFTVPPAAVEVARNDVGPQAFRLRRNLAVQFHPEVDEDNVRTWIDLGGEASVTALAAVGTTADEVLAASREHRHRAETDVATLVTHFLDDVAGAA
jgi:GMP synthase-like glutamine amidotransferase